MRCFAFFEMMLLRAYCLFCFELTMHVSDQIGDGTTSQRLTPVNVTGLGRGVQGISLGGVRQFAMQCCDCSACFLPWIFDTRDLTAIGVRAMGLTL